MTDIYCPKCKARFGLESHMKEKITGFSSFLRAMWMRRYAPIISKRKHGDVLGESNTIVCPECGFEFRDDNYWYFNIVRPNTLRLILIIFIGLVFIAFPIFLIIRDLVE